MNWSRESSAFSTGRSNSNSSKQNRTYNDVPLLTTSTAFQCWPRKLLRSHMQQQKQLYITKATTNCHSL